MLNSTFLFITPVNERIKKNSQWHIFQIPDLKSEKNSNQCYFISTKLQSRRTLFLYFNECCLLFVSSQHDLLIVHVYALILWCFHLISHPQSKWKDTLNDAVGKTILKPSKVGPLLVALIIIHLIFIYPFLHSSAYKHNILEREFNVIWILSFIKSILCFIVEIV